MVDFVPTKQLKFPESDAHFYKYDHYQREIYEAALEYTPGRTCAVDVGAHVGIFTLYMAADFMRVYAFEPVPENYVCLCENLHKFGGPNHGVLLCNKALTSTPTTLHIAHVCPTNSGTWEVGSEGVEVIGLPLDDLCIVKPDLIKLDIQGHELQALVGAYSTITTHKPTIIIELWGETDTSDVQAYLELTLDYKQVARINKDCVYVAR